MVWSSWYTDVNRQGINFLKEVWVIPQGILGFGLVKNHKQPVNIRMVRNLSCILWTKSRKHCFLPEGVISLAAAKHCHLPTRFFSILLFTIRENNIIKVNGHTSKGDHYDLKLFTSLLKGVYSSRKESLSINSRLLWEWSHILEKRILFSIVFPFDQGGKYFQLSVPLICGVASYLNK